MTATLYIDPEAQLKADYADLGVSCGCIGNIWYGPIRDDRSFRVFTRLQPAVRAQLDALRARVASGELFCRQV
jgi:hypothetical protein